MMVCELGQPTFICPTYLDPNLLKDLCKEILIQEPQNGNFYRVKVELRPQTRE